MSFNIFFIFVVISQVGSSSQAFFLFSDITHAMPCVRIYCTPSPLRYALTNKDPVGSGTTT